MITRRRFFRNASATSIALALDRHSPGPLHRFRQEIDFYFRSAGKEWQRIPESVEISGMHHNVLGGFLDLRPALSAWGTGSASFRGFRYWPQVAVPT